MQVDSYSTLQELTLSDEFQIWKSDWSRPFPPPHLWLDYLDDPFAYTLKELSTDEVDDWDLEQMVPRATLDRLYNGRVSTRIPYFLLHTIDITNVNGEGRPCVDIGCGINELGKNYHDVWGVDIKHWDKHSDETLHSTWYSDNSNKWDRVISMNALHFGTIEEIRDNLVRLEGILKENGKAVVGLNRARIKEWNANYDDKMLVDMISSLPTVTRIVLVSTPLDATMDGNIFIWINK